MLLCRCPKLTPLQSRFAASLIALLFLGLVYWSLSKPHFAYAAELELDGSGQARGGADHNWHRLEQQQQDNDVLDGAEEKAEYQLEHGRDVPISIFRRASLPSTINGNNSPNVASIQASNTTIWEYSKALLAEAPAAQGSGLPSDPGTKRDLRIDHAELRRRDGLEARQDDTAKTIYVSINTCQQPTWNGTGVQSVAPPQLILYVSTDASNTNPGPSADSTLQTSMPLSEGFANISTVATGDWYISVNAPALPANFTGEWSYELAVSTDDYYHAAEQTTSFLFLVDTDNVSALLVTEALTQQNASSPIFQAWMDLSAPFIVFGANVDYTSTMGIASSYCGWSHAHQIAGDQTDVNGTRTGVQMNMITRGVGDKPREQFHVSNLNSSSTYSGVLAQYGNSTNAGSGVVGGGGKVWPTVTWTTKTDGNCALLYNLTFCSNVAYSVPANPTQNTTEQLRVMFDNYTQTYYQNFNYSLQQVPCNTTSEAQYSLTKTCDDCAAAYKDWLCAVSIPRCVDFSSPTALTPYLQPRAVAQPFISNASYLPDAFLTSNYVPMSGAPTLPGSPRDTQIYNTSLATNQSRNPIIDTLVGPGPYKELLPCEDLCFALMQSCPASLGFGCPSRGKGLEVGYGVRSANGSLTCNFPGAVFRVGSGALRAKGASAGVVVGLAVVVALVLNS